MSSKQLFTLLEELGINEPIHTVDNLTWTCEQEGSKAVVKWLCRNVSKDNVLSLDELAEYTQLMHKGKVLKGEELDKAFRKLTRGNEEDVEELEEMIKQTRKETELLDEDAQSLKRRLGRLQKLENSLSEQQLSMSTDMSGNVMHGASDHEAAMADLIVLNQKMNTILESMAATAEQIERNNTGEGAGGRLQLLLSSFRPFLRQNDLCLKEIKRWHQKQFEGGAARIVEKEAASPMPDLALPEILRNTLAGERLYSVQKAESQHWKRVRELDRLCQAFGYGEEQHVKHLSKKAHAEASLKFAYSQQSSAGRGILEDDSSLRLKSEDQKGLLSHLHRDETRLKSQISSLSKELAQLNSTYVFQGDYELKRRRQEYYLQRYKKFISHLVQLLALHTVLLKAFLLETELHKAVRTLVISADTEIGSAVAAATERVGGCNLLKDAAARSLAGNCDDGSLDSLYQQVGALLHARAGSNSEEPKPSVKAVISALEEFKDGMAALRARIIELQNQEKNTVLPELASKIGHARKLLFSAKNGHQALLVPEDVVSLLNELETLSHSTETAVGAVQNRQKRFNHVLQDMGDAMQVERRVFSDFFCNPDGLLSTVRDLEQRTDETRPRHRFQ